MEVLELLLKNEIKTHIETDENVIIIRETYVPSVYHCLHKGDYLVMFPYIDERIFRCKIFKESDFQKGFKII